MTNKEFIIFVSDKTGISQKEITYYLDIIELGLKEKIEQMQCGEKIKVCDLTFERKKVKPHIGRNPKTLEEYKVPAMEKIKVKFSPDWKRILRD